MLNCTAMCVHVVPIICCLLAAVNVGYVACVPCGEPPEFNNIKEDTANITIEDVLPIFEGAEEFEVEFNEMILLNSVLGPPVQPQELEEYKNSRNSSIIDMVTHYYKFKNHPHSLHTTGKNGCVFRNLVTRAWQSSHSNQSDIGEEPEIKRVDFKRPSHLACFTKEEDNPWWMAELDGSQGYDILQLAVLFGYTWHRKEKYPDKVEAGVQAVFGQPPSNTTCASLEPHHRPFAMYKTCNCKAGVKCKFVFIRGSSSSLVLALVKVWGFTCPDGLAGQNCEKDLKTCNSNPCDERRKHCVNKIGKYECKSRPIATPDSLSIEPIGKQFLISWAVTAVDKGDYDYLELAYCPERHVGNCRNFYHKKLAYGEISFLVSPPKGVEQYRCTLAYYKNSGEKLAESDPYHFETRDADDKTEDETPGRHKLGTTSYTLIGLSVVALCAIVVLGLFIGRAIKNKHMVNLLDTDDEEDQGTDQNDENIQLQEVDPYQNPPNEELHIDWDRLPRMQEGQDEEDASNYQSCSIQNGSNEEIFSSKEEEYDPAKDFRSAKILQRKSV